jgi:hypothetical protein
MKPVSKFLGLLCTVILSIGQIIPTLHSDGPTDNHGEIVRPIPPTGIILNADQQKQLETDLEKLRHSIESARNKLAKQPALQRYLSDIQVFEHAVTSAILYQEIYEPAKEFKQAKEQLEVASNRLEQLLSGKPAWLHETNLVPRGYVSRIDDSIQPYGLVVPVSWHPNRSKPIRLDIWFHGRGEKLTELSFLNQCLHSPGQFTPDDTIVLHLYGRYCNANKFAGEIDLFEALEHVQQDYAIDTNRIIVRGFSMGGAACWQFATHYAGLWAAAAPGAGFSETKEFLEFFQKETLTPYWWEKKLWNLYDATAYAENLFQCPTVAYSGAIDRQKQAADIMSLYLENEGLQLTHLIGPDTAHKYHPEAKTEINRRIDRIAEKGRDAVPNKIRFTTYTLRYHKMNWIELEGLMQHWERARVQAELTSNHEVSIHTSNVSQFRIRMEAGQCPLDITQTPIITIDDQSLEVDKPKTDLSWDVILIRVNDVWKQAGESTNQTLRKKHGLQGPIDDAFMDRFLMVGPSSWPMNSTVGDWVSDEMSHAMRHWRQQFRGKPRFKMDHEVTEQDIRESHLVLWGDPSSNTLIRKIVKQLPIKWDHQGIHTPQKKYTPDRYLPALIYPNPLNPEKYVVINSGFTYREYDYLNNARQVPKLPDWAILDLSQPPTSRWPAGITNAGFFGENWEWLPPVE